MNSSSLWVRPDLVLPGPVDTVIFDVDGVLWDTGDSFDQAIGQTVEFLLRHVYGDSTPRPVTREELRVLRQAGGLNNDWHLSYTLLALRLAGREDVAAAAGESGGRGRAWAETILPPGVEIDFERLHTVFDEIYWGEQTLRQVYGRTPYYVFGAPGAWRNERPLWSDGLLESLQAVGVRYFGIGTGRNSVELSAVLAGTTLGRQIPTQAIVTADTASKPDGRVLQLILEGLAPTAGNGNLSRAQTPPQTALFCGDTRDDVQTVLNYRALPPSSGVVAPMPRVLAVAVVPVAEFVFYQASGSDAAVAHIDQTPTLVKMINRLAEAPSP